MLTSYPVKCPHLGCGWKGELIPQLNHEPWHGQVVGRRPVVQFQCPKCHGEWRGRVVGDDVVPLPPEPAVSQA